MGGCRHVASTLRRALALRGLPEQCDLRGLQLAGGLGRSLVRRERLGLELVSDAARLLLDALHLRLEQCACTSDACASTCG